MLIKSINFDYSYGSVVTVSHYRLAAAPACLICLHLSQLDYFVPFFAACGGQQITPILREQRLGRG